MKTNVFRQVSSIIILTLLLIVVAALTSSAQNSKANGAWSTGTNWTGNIAPINWSNGNVNMNHDITAPTAINGLTSVTLGASKTFISGTSGTPQDLSMQSVTTFTVNGAMTVYGNLTLTGNTALVIAGSGSLTVTGTITLSGSSSITNNGTGAITAGAISMPSGSMSITANSALTVSGAFSQSGSSTFTKAGTGNISVGSLAVTGGTFAVNNGSLSSSGAVTQSGGSTITMASATGGFSATTYTSSGSGGTFNVNNGSATFSGLMTLGSATTINVASGKSLTVGGYTSGNNADAVLNNNGTTTVNGNMTQGGPVNNNSSGTLQVNGNFTPSTSNSAVTNTSGIMNVTGDMTLAGSSKLQVNPHANSMVMVYGTTAVLANENLTIGTGVAPTPYASMAILGDLQMNGSGDVRVRQNGRFAVMGNITGNGGGTLLTVDNGGQMYVDKNINLNGNGSSGGNIIANNNSASPYGLYVNGTITNSNGGPGSSTTSSNNASKATMQTTNAPFAAWVAGLPTTPMPVTLISFEVKAYTQTGVVLGWATATEKNFNYFAIEKSTDGKVFSEVGTVQGAGNSKTKRNYTFEDALIGRAYYRLKAVDFDGTTEYFTVITATATTRNTVDVYPNPSAGKSINVQVNFELASDAVIEIFNNVGLSIYRGSVTGFSTEVDFDTTLKPGTYLVKFTSSEKSQMTRFVVR